MTSAITRARHIFATLALIAAFAASLAACGGRSSADGSSGGGQAGNSTTTYTNDEHRFSITYDTVFTEGEPGGQAASGPAFTVAFVDTGGTHAGGRYMDGLRVTVHELPRTVRPAEVRALKRSAEAAVAARLASLASVVVEPLVRTTVNGTPGFTASYTFVRGGVHVNATSSFLFSGSSEYEVTGQASREDWTGLRPALEAALASFTVR